MKKHNKRKRHKNKIAKSIQKANLNLNQQLDLTVRIVRVCATSLRTIVVGSYTIQHGTVLTIFPLILHMLHAKRQTRWAYTNTTSLAEVIIVHTASNHARGV